jgi:hypothetical protein
MNYILPVKAIKYEGDITNVDSLFTKKLLQIGIKESSKTIIKGKGYIILDYGKEISGGVRILSFSVQGERTVRLRFGESVSETLADIGFKNATNNHSTRDMVVELQTFSDMTFAQTGFRFLRIDFLDENGYYEIESVLASEIIDEKTILGSFNCNDEIINNIFNTATYTLRLCIQNGYFWDGIKRDRLVWIGDLYPEMLASHCLYGIRSEINSSLDFAKETTPLPTWVSNIPAYSLWWIINAYDEYFYSGNSDYIIKTADYTYGIIKMVNELVDENGYTHFPSNFIDWPTAYLEGESKNRELDRLTGMRYLTHICAEKAKKLLTIANYDVSNCDSIINKLNKVKNEVKQYKQIAGLGVLSGDLNENNLKVILNGGANGLSTFMSYPILKGISAFNRHDDALSILKTYYGGMLSVGATTFWEDFDIKWLDNCFRIDELPIEGKIDIHGDYGAYCYKGFRHSFCHGWSAGVIPYLIEEVAGIKVVDVGCKKIEIKPNLSNLNYVKAKFPTPYGVVEVEHKIIDGKVVTTINAPNEIEIIK